MKIPIEDISLSSWYVRKNIENIRNLQDSIKHIGLLHPIIVKKQGIKYVLITGRRRLMAMKNLGATVIEVKMIESDLDYSEEILIQWYENTWRHPLEYDELAKAKNIIYNIQTKDQLKILLEDDE